MIHYGVTKAAELALTNGIAQLTRATGVTINAVLPGPTASEGVTDFVGQLAAKAKQSTTESRRNFFAASDRPPYCSALPAWMKWRVLSSLSARLWPALQTAPPCELTAAWYAARKIRSAGLRTGTMLTDQLQLADSETRAPLGYFGRTQMF